MIHFSPQYCRTWLIVPDPAGAGFSADILTMCSSERLSALEEEFADRYTKHDEEFVKTLATPTHPPPCVTPWWSNDKGDR